MMQIEKPIGAIPCAAKNKIFLFTFQSTDHKEAVMHMIRKLAAILMLAVLLAMPCAPSAFAKATAYPPAPDSAVMVADVVAARPIGLASLVIGTLAFIVSSPFSALGDNLEQAYQLMIVDPALYTFKRPLGAF